jgi:transposase-like protein
VSKMETKRGSGPGRQGKRRRFTDEFKAGAVRLVLDEGKTVAQVARDLSTRKADRDERSLRLRRWPTASGFSDA